MTGNSDGLSPSLKPFLGVGHNRALPSPFGFGNGIQGAGGYLVANAIRGVTFKRGITVECWADLDTTVDGVGKGAGFRMFSPNNMLQLSTGTYNQSDRLACDNNVNDSWGAVTGFIPTGKVLYAVMLAEDGYCYLHSNGGYVNGGHTWKSQQIYSPVESEIGTMEILKYQYYGAREIRNTIDEFRVYNKALNSQELFLHYNAGIGENPSNTENLKAWYKFEQFENLDFSALQDNSDMKLGIRDHSGQNNHLQPVDLDTNPLSPNYVLKPF